MLSEKMLAALNAQIRDELYSQMLYLSMSAWADSEDLPGMAAFMHLKADEEHAHGMKIFEYVLDRGGRVEMQAIEQPPADFGDFTNMFKEQLIHEQKVTASIHNLYALASEEKDYATKVMLQWFIEEQVEEEKEASDLIQQCKLIGESKSALFMFDQKLMSETPGENGPA